MKKTLLNLVVTCVFLGSSVAQNTFSSGSTGADGAFAPAQSATIQVPASGVFNYTTVNIPSTVTITYVRNSANTPLTILATSDVDISGSIVVDGQPGSPMGFGGLGGPGAGSGGEGAFNQNNWGVIGDGPGGGGGGIATTSNGNSACTGGAGGGFQTATAAPSYFGLTSTGGASYGSSLLVPLLAGSGGGGGGGFNSNPSGGGGGGGGAILIASSTQIVFPSTAPGATISAQGGAGGKNTAVPSGGGGSGGAIHLMANTITGYAQLKTAGGAPGCPSGCSGTMGAWGGGFGYARAEAFNFSAFNPTASFQMTAGTPFLPSTGSLPTLQIASIAGVTAPATPIGSFSGTPDVILPAGQANPVSVVVNATNIAVGTTVTLTAKPTSGTAATASASLSGTNASSSATLSINLPATLSVLTATTTTFIADSRPMFMDGEKVDKIEVASTLGGPSLRTYITHSGRRISAPN